jgi:hypothetical protein
MFRQQEKQEWIWLDADGFELMQFSAVALKVAVPKSTDYLLYARGPCRRIKA